jgi:VIT1/CCC1 family predicted Fe2+/Mn2+ transporter
MMMNNLRDLKARFDFWYVKNFFKLEKQYTFFMDLSNPQNFAVKLLGKFDGVIVEYSNIEMSDDAQMSFYFNVIANPNLCNTESKAFKKFTANVMRSILLSAVENAEKVIDENRNSDLVESDAQRTVHEESVAVSEERVPDRKPRKKVVRRSKKIRSTVQQSATDSSTGD